MNPNAAIIVTGCYAQTDPDRVSGLPGVVLVAGTDQKDLLPESVRRIAFGPMPDRAETGRSEGRQANTGFGYAPDIRLPGHTRGFLKIQDGCEAFCSYCIVPYARGRSRSLDPAMVLQRLAALEQTGFREVVLSGIHLGMYGQDLHPKITLLDLLRVIEESGIPLSRLRLSSVEPTEITHDLIAHVSRSRLICRHFHIPLQSGSNKILTMMNRCYTIQVFREVIENIASATPDACIGIDVMAGFPGETEKDFRETADLLQDLPASYFHVFPYSRRPGTKAASMPGQVSERLKKERASILRKLGDEKRREFYARFEGRKVSVLVENRKDPRTGMMKGFSDNYIPVLIEPDETGKCVEGLATNRIIETLITEVSDRGVLGRVLENGKQKQETERA